MKGKIFNPLQSAASNFFRYDGYERVAGVDGEEFGILEKENYGTTSMYQQKKKSSPTDNIFLIGGTFIIAVVIFVFVLNGISKTEKPQVDVLNSLPTADDVTVEDRLVQSAKEEASITLNDDVASETDTQPDGLKGDAAVEELMQLQSEQAEVAKELEEILSKEKDLLKTPPYERINDLESQLKEQLQQKDELLTKEIKYVEDIILTEEVNKVEDRLGEVKA